MSLSPMDAGCSKDDDSEGITVAIRMRPLNLTEGSNGRVWKVLPKYSSVTQTTRDGKPLTERVTGRTFFTFDKTFGEDTNNQKVYESVAKGIVGSAVQGLNGTIFAYGQTSSGKTYTMQGSGNLEQGTIGNGEGGLVHMAASDIFAQIQEQQNRMFLVRVSFLEIYNEEVRDLLADSNHALQIREDPRRGVFVQSVEEIVTDFDSLLAILIRGDKSRTFAATGMNERSSRSHTILRITIESREKDTTGASSEHDGEDQVSGGDGAIRISTLNLVDLAGSESVRHTGATGERQKEGGLINQSLLTLSRVIVALGTPNPMHINFRDSKLTRILQPSLSGNARMAVICCATPSELYLEETRSTLQFASRAKLVKTNAQVNEVLDERSMIRRLQRELAEARRYQSGPENDQVRDLEKQVETAGTQAMEARAKLDRLKSSILNAGYLFDHAVSESITLGSPASAHISKKRRKSDGQLQIGRATPSKKFMACVPSPKTAPRSKQTQMLQKSSLSTEQELSLVQHALTIRNQHSQDLHDRIHQYVAQIAEKSADLDGLMEENMELNEANSNEKYKVDKLQKLVATMQESMQKTQQENEKLLVDKDTEISQLKASLLEKSAFEKEVQIIRNRFEEIQEQRDKNAFELAEISKEKEELLKENQSNNFKLQEIVIKSETLSANLHDVIGERDDARLQLEKTIYEGNEYAKLQESIHAGLKENLKDLTAACIEMSNQKENLEEQARLANMEILSSIEQATVLKRELDQREKRYAVERQTKENEITEASLLIDRLTTENESIEKLQADLQDSTEQIHKMTLRYNESLERSTSLEASVENLISQKDGLQLLANDLEDRIKATSETNDALLLERRHLIDELSKSDEQLAASSIDLRSLREKNELIDQQNQALLQQLDSKDRENEWLLENHEATLREHDETVRTLQSNLSVLNEELDAASSIKEKLVNQVEVLEQNAEAFEASKRALEVLIEARDKERIETRLELQEALDRVSALCDEKSVVVAEKDSMAKELSSSLRSLEEMKSQLTVAEGRIERLRQEKSAAIVAGSQSLTKIQQLSSDLTKEKSRIGDLEGSAKELRTTLEDRDLEISRLRLELAVCSQSISSERQKSANSSEILAQKVAEVTRLQEHCQVIESELENRTEDFQRLLESSYTKDNKINELIGEKKKAYDDLQRNVSTSEAECENLQSIIAQLEAANATFESTLNAKEGVLHELEREKGSLLSKVHGLLETVESLTLERDDIQGMLQEMASERDKISSRQKFLVQETEMMTKQKEELQVNICQLKSENLKKDGVLKAIGDDLEHALAGQLKAEQSLAALQTEYNQAKEHIVRLEDRFNTAISEANAVREQNTKLKNTAESQRHELQAEQSKTDQLVEKLDNALASRAQLVKELQDCELQRDEAAVEVEKLLEANRELKEKLSCLMPKETEQLLRAMVSKLRAENDENKQMLASVNDSQACLQKRAAELEEDLLSKISQLENTKSTLKERNNEILQWQSNLRVKEEVLNELEREKDRLSSEVHELLETIESLTQSRKDIEVKLQEMASERKEISVRQEFLLQETEMVTKQKEELQVNICLIESESLKKDGALKAIGDDIAKALAGQLKAEQSLAALQTENNQAKEHIVFLEDRMKIALSEANAVRDQNTKLKHTAESKLLELEAEQSKNDQLVEALDNTRATRDRLAKDLHDCELQRDEAAVEAENLFEANRELKEKLSCLIPKETEQMLQALISELRAENVENKQLLASVNDSQAWLRKRVAELEEEILSKSGELENTKSTLEERNNEILQLQSHSKQSEQNAIHLQETQQTGKLLERIEEMEKTLTDAQHTWKVREEELMMQMREEQSALIQEGENVMEDLRRELEERQSKLSLAESEAYAARQEIEEISDERRRYEERYLEMNGRVSSLEGVNEVQEATISELQAELGKAKKECYTLKESAIEMKEKMRRSARDSEKALKETDFSVKEVARLRKQNEAYQLEIDRMRNKIRETSTSDNEVERLKKQLHTASSALSGLQKEFDALQNERDQANVRVNAQKEENVTKNYDESEVYATQVMQANQVIKKLKNVIEEKDKRIQKLNNVRMTKEKMEKIKNMKNANQELEKKCSSLITENAKLRTQVSGMGTETEIRTEVSELRFDKEALERKLRKFATHCQRLEDDRAGMADALRSCNIDLQAHGNDITNAIVHLCDKIASIEKVHAKQVCFNSLKDVSQQQDNENLRDRVRDLSEQLDSCKNTINEMRRLHQQANDRPNANIQQKLVFLEQENLQLIRDLKMSKKQLQNTRTQLESLQLNVETPSIDFALESSSASAFKDDGPNKDSSNTVELTEMAKTFSSHAVQGKQEIQVAASKPPSSNKKKTILNDSTNHEPSDGKVSHTMMIIGSERKRQRRAPEQKAKRVDGIPGLGESSYGENYESTSECKQS